MTNCEQKREIVFKHVREDRPIVVYHANERKEKQEKLEAMGAWFFNESSGLTGNQCSPSN